MAGVFGRFGIVRHHDDGLAVLTVEQLQKTQYFFGRLTIQIAGGLITDQKRGVGDERGCNRHRRANDAIALFAAAHCAATQAY